MRHAEFQFNPYMTFAAIFAIYFSLILPHKNLAHLLVKKITMHIAPGKT